MFAARTADNCNASGSTEALPSLHCLGSAGPEDCGTTSRADVRSVSCNLDKCPRMVRKPTQPSHRRRWLRCFGPWCPDRATILILFSCTPIAKCLLTIY